MLPRGPRPPAMWLGVVLVLLFMISTSALLVRRPRNKRGGAALPETDDELRLSLFHSDGIATYFDAVGHRDAQRRTLRAQNAPAALCMAAYRNASNAFADPCKHGICVDNACQCDDDAVKGHWIGFFCDECERGWAGASCTDECRGGSCNRCSSHGTCNEGVQGDGTCTCYATRSTGYWGGANCSQCADNYFGATCESACPGLELTGTACFGRGICVTGLGGVGECRCNDGYGSESGCFECDFAHWGANCANTCDGYIASSNKPCSGHGYCINGTSGTGTCVCDSTWGLRDCSRQCDGYNATTGRACGHGMCMDGANGPATCTCFGNFAPPNCEQCIANMTGSGCDQQCLPTTGGPVCSKNGVCTYRTANGREFAQCECVAGYYNAACNLKCPGDPPCSGHGNCSSTQQRCICDEGFTGEQCDECSAAYRGTTCTKKCPVGRNGNACNDLGTCWEGFCYCDVALSSTQDFCGDACDTQVFDSATNQLVCPTNQTGYRKCPFPGRYGPTCVLLCPGTSTSSSQTVCSGHGYCDDGTTGTGVCTCTDGYGTASCAVQCPVGPLGICSGIGRGVCETTGVTLSNPQGVGKCKCNEGYGDVACNSTCPRVAGKVCAGHGSCDTDGDASCTCVPSYTSPSCDVPCGCDLRNGLCNATQCAGLLSWETCTICDCKPGFTGLCNECIAGRQGADCQGVCSPNGITVGLECICNEHWSGAACDIPCQRFNDTICGGRGTCLWGNTKSGACNCDDEYYGNGCRQHCTIEKCQTNDQKPLMHPQCNVQTGICECQDNLQGHWSGETCSQCNPRYWGPTCQEECQCNDHGECDQNTGECRCYASNEQGYYAGTYCEKCASGYIGQRCSRQNIDITRVNRFRVATEEVQEGGESRLVAVNSDGTVVYAGGSTIYRYVPRGLELRVTGETVTPAGTCAQEVARMFIRDSFVYYVLQPDACGMPARVARNAAAKERPDENRTTVQTVLQDLDYVNLTNPVLQSTATRVVGVDATDADFPVIFFVLVDSYNPDGSARGGYVGRLLTTTAFQGDPASRLEQRLDDSFSARTLAAAAIVSTLGSDQEIVLQIVIGGQRAVGDTVRWSMLFFRSGISRFENALSAATSEYMEDLVSCWPFLDASGNTAVADACTGCNAVDQVTFFGSTVVASIFSTGSSNQTVFVRFRPWSSVTGGETIWTSFINSDTGECKEGRYDQQSGSIVPATAGNEALGSGNIPVVYVQLTNNDDLETRATAISTDTASTTVYVAMASTQEGQPSRLSKLFIASGALQLSGSKLLSFVEQSASSNATVPEKIAMLAPSPTTRLLHGIVADIGYVRIATFLMYEVTSVSPDIADRRPGTKLVLRGSGFTPGPGLGTSAVFDPMCVVGVSSAQPASNVTFSSMECIAPDATDAVASIACVGERVAASLYGGNSTWFTDNDVRLRRIEAPRITQADPPSGGRSGGTKVMLHGTGFVDTTYSTCTFWSPSPRGYETVTTTFFWEKSNLGYCIQPATANASVSPSYINVSIDGQVPAPFGPVPYEIVGSPHSLHVEPRILRKADNVTQADIVVTVVDSESHPLGSLDSRNRLICIDSNITVDVCDPALFRWRNPDDGYPWPPCRNNSINVEDVCVMAANGSATFPNVTLYTPRTGRLLVTFVTSDSEGGVPWEIATEIVITNGDAFALALQNSVELSGKPVINGRSLSPNPEVVVVDHLGNIVGTLPQPVTVAARPYYYMDPDFGGPNASSTIFEGSNTFVEHRGDYNTFRFEQVFIKYVHGAQHFVEFTSVPELVPALSPALRTQECDNAHIAFKVANTSECEACPPIGAVCNGSEYVEVLPGYWRGQTTTYIYECPAGPSICLGSRGAAGSECAEGYEGPLCALCTPGWGRSGLTSCSKCEPLATSITVLIGGGLAFLAVLLVWTTITLRQGAVTDVSVIFRTVVNHMQATGKLGEFSQQWAPLLKDLFQFQDSASSPSVSGVSSLDCVLRHTGNDYSAVFYAYMSLPIVSGLMAVLVFAVVRVLKLKPVLSEELEKEVEHDIKTIGTGADIAILKVRYPWHMVVTTTLCVNMFAMYQTLITQSTTVLSCVDLVVEDGQQRSFVKVDMSIPCEGGRHKMSTAGLLFAIGYGFGIPSAFIFGYQFMNGRLGRPAQTRAMFMFLIGGYQDGFWWWQTLIMVRKLLLVLIVVFITDPELQTYCGMWTMGFALILQVVLSPNSQSSFNQVEALSLAIITVTLNFSLLYFWPQMTDAAKDALTVLLIAATFGAILMFAAFLFKPMRAMFLEKVEVAKSLQSTVEAVLQGAAESTQSRGPKAFKSGRAQRARSRGREDDEDDEDDEELEPVGTLSAPTRINLTAPVDGGQGGGRPIARAPTFEEHDVDADEHDFLTRSFAGRPVTADEAQYL